MKKVLKFPRPVTVTTSGPQIILEVSRNPIIISPAVARKLITKLQLALSVSTGL